jgi:hypothetical protein
MNRSNLQEIDNFELQMINGGARVRALTEAVKWVLTGSGIISVIDQVRDFKQGFDDHYNN